MLGLYGGLGVILRQWKENGNDYSTSGLHWDSGK